MDQDTGYNLQTSERQRSPNAHATRHSSAYQNSSAFSASANPDEDWTQISDLAERRRIQNRIAQRNYRKKLKRRLEDFEKRAAASTSPEQSIREAARLTPGSSSNISHGNVRRRISQTSSVGYESNHSPEPSVNDHWSDLRQSTSPSFSFVPSAPPTYSYSSFPPSSDYFTALEYNSQDSRHLQPMYSDAMYQPVLSHTVSPSLPSMGSYDSLGPDVSCGAAEMLNSFDMNYASLAGIAVPMSRGSTDQTLRTPPLTDSASYVDSSRECSPFGPTGPVSPEIQLMLPTISPRRR